MKFKTAQPTSGIALIIVMIAIFVLSVLIGMFALSMKVETRLAMNANRDAESVWEGVSGMEVARWVLAEQSKCRYDSLDQKWAGGPGGECDTNGFLAEIDLNNFPITENRTVAIKIYDLDCRININTARPELLQQALTVMGVDAGQIPGVVGAIVDWIDENSGVSPNGEESAYYQTLNPPYYAKDGPIDDLSELLWVKGIPHEMFPAFQENFTALSGDTTGKVNINTAPASVLAVFFSGDLEAAERVVSLRSETPAGSPHCPDVPTLLINAGFGGPQAQQLAQNFSVKSTVFRVEVSPLNSSRRYVGIIGRNGPQETRVLSFHWENPVETRKE